MNLERINIVEVTRRKKDHHIHISNCFPLFYYIYTLPSKDTKYFWQIQIYLLPAKLLISFSLTICHTSPSSLHCHQAVMKWNGAGGWIVKLNGIFPKEKSIIGANMRQSPPIQVLHCFSPSLIYTSGKMWVKVVTSYFHWYS